MGADRHLGSCWGRCSNYGALHKRAIVRALFPVGWWVLEPACTSPSQQAGALPQPPRRLLNCLPPQPYPPLPRQLATVSSGWEERGTNRPPAAQPPSTTLAEVLGGSQAGPTWGSLPPQLQPWQNPASNCMLPLSRMELHTAPLGAAHLPLILQPE